VTPSVDAAKVDAVLAGGLEAGVFSGAALWVGLGGRTVLHTAVGRRAAHPGAAGVDPDTAFDLASLTKPLAAVTCAMHLVQAGRLRLEDPVTRHVPAFGAGLDAERRGAVTVAHLLAHASGLPAWRPYFEAARAREAAEPGFIGGPAARRWGVEAVCAEPLERPPGTEAVYSDLGFILLGAVLERVAEAPLEALFEARVAGPLGLKRTGFNPGNTSPGPFGENVAVTTGSPWRGGDLAGVVHDDNAYVMGGVAGHAGLFGTAADVGRWATAMLDAWHGRGTLLSGAVARRFLAPEARVPGSSWVLGLDTPTPPSSGGRYPGPRSVGHLGYTGTSVWIDPERAWAVALLTNRVHTDPAGEGIRRFRPALHDAVGRALFGA
jgi:CubicO group peptidase (beta-lactamase class C family)